MLFYPVPGKIPQVARLDCSVANNRGRQVHLERRLLSLLACLPLCLVQFPARACQSEKSMSVTDSLWGSLILQKACERDCELARINKKLRLTDRLTSVSAFASSSLDVSHHIGDLATLKSTGNPAAPGVVGVVAAATGLGGLSLGLVFNRHYGKLACRRQAEIQGRVDGLFKRLRDGEQSPELKAAFEQLVGEQAALELMAACSAHARLALARTAGH